MAGEIVDAVEAEELTVGLAGFHDSVGHKQDAVAGVEVEADFFVNYVREDAEGEAAGDGDLLAVEVGG